MHHCPECHKPLTTPQARTRCLLTDSRYRAYRDDPYEPRPYTVHGGRRYDPPSQQVYKEPNHPRPWTSGDRYPPVRSPDVRYDFHQRRRVGPEYLPHEPRQQPIERVVQLPRPQSYANAPVKQPPKDFPFIQQLCDRLDEVLRRQFDECQEHNALQTEAELHQNDGLLHLAAVKALRGKQHELESIKDEINTIYNTLLTCMNRMDQADWNFVRDYAVLQRRVV